MPRRSRRRTSMVTPNLDDGQAAPSGDAPGLEAGGREPAEGDGQWRLGCASCVERARGDRLLLCKGCSATKQPLISQYVHRRKRKTARTSPRCLSHPHWAWTTTEEHQRRWVLQQKPGLSRRPQLCFQRAAVLPLAPCVRVCLFFILRPLPLQSEQEKRPKKSEKRKSRFSTATTKESTFHWSRVKKVLLLIGRFETQNKYVRAVSRVLETVFRLQPVHDRKFWAQRRSRLAPAGPQLKLGRCGVHPARRALPPSPRVPAAPPPSPSQPNKSLRPPPHPARLPALGCFVNRVLRHASRTASSSVFDPPRSPPPTSNHTNHHHGSRRVYHARGRDHHALVGVGLCRWWRAGWWPARCRCVCTASGCGGRPPGTGGSAAGHEGDH